METKNKAAPPLSEQSCETDNDQSAFDQILLRMRKQKDFPTFYQNVVEINKTIKSTYASASEIANVILKDYSLTKKLLTLVNSAFYGQNRGGITTISEAVILVGLNQVQMAIASLMFFEQMQQNSHTAELKDSSIHAFISGLIAREISKKWNRDDTEEACICAMFHNLGKCMALFYLPDQHKEVIEYAADHKVDLQRASRAVLGLTYEDLGIGVAKNLGLPTKITRSMKSISENDRKTITSNPMRAIAYLSNLLCDTAIESSNSKREKSIKKIEENFGLTGEYVFELYANVWEKLNKYSKIFNINLKDSPILSRFSKNFIVQDEAPPKDSEYSVITDEFYDIVTKGIANITKILLEDTFELNSILSMVLEIMYRGFGFSHVLICILDFKTNQMIPRYGLGDDIQNFMKTFSFRITPSNDFFNVALHQSEAIYIKDIHDPPDRLMIPDWYRDTIHAMDAMVYPIIINEKKIGLFYADREEKRTDFSGTQLEYMNILCNQAALAIKQKGR